MRSNSFSSEDSRTSLRDKVAGTSSFVEKCIKKITVEDPKERFKLKEEETKAKLKARGIDENSNPNMSPGLKQSKSKVLEKRKLEEMKTYKSKSRIKSVLKKKFLDNNKTQAQPLRMSQSLTNTRLNKNKRLDNQTALNEYTDDYHDKNTFNHTALNHDVSDFNAYTKDTSNLDGPYIQTSSSKVNVLNMDLKSSKQLDLFGERKPDNVLRHIDSI